MNSTSETRALPAGFHLVTVIEAVDLSVPTKVPDIAEPQHEGERLHRLKHLGESGAHLVHEGLERGWEAVEHSIEWWKQRNLPHGLIEISTKAASAYAFSDGGPRLRVVYASDPAIPNRFHALGEYHKRIREEKFEELVRLLTALGARSIRVTFGDDTNESKAVSVNEVGVQFKRSQTTKRDMVYEAVHRPQGDPYIPTGLHWLEHEPFWRAIVDGRMSGNAAKTYARVQSTEYSATVARLCLELPKVGLDIGGEQQSTDNTVWDVEVDFEAQ